MYYVLYQLGNLEEKDDNKPIYQGARLTVAASILLIITFVIGRMD